MVLLSLRFPSQWAGQGWGRTGLAAGGGGIGESPVEPPIAVAKVERRARQIKEVNLGILPKFEALITRVTAPRFIGIICEDNYVVK